MESFGQRLRRLRIERKMTPSQLAYRVGVTEGAIRQIEVGRTKQTTFLLGLKLARVLGVEPWALAAGEGGADPTELAEQDDDVRLVLADLQRRVATLERCLPKSANDM